MQRSILSLGILAMSAHTLHAEIIADSEADFGAIQGVNGWFYGYYHISEGDSPTNPASFRQLEVFGGDLINAWNRPGSSDWASITDRTFHPHLPGAGRNDPNEYWISRRWVSDRSGTLNITGLIDEADLGGDSVNASIYVDGIETVKYQLSTVINSMIEYDIDVAVSAGSTIELVVSPRLNIFFDGTVFTAIIEGDPLCAADFTGDGSLDIFDVFAFLDAFNAMDPGADFTGDGSFDIFDVFAYLDAFNAGCA